MDNPACPELQPGNPGVPGATLVTVNNQSGVNFSVAAPEATAVWLCLFDQSNQETRLPMSRSEQGIWHGFVVGAGEGQAYGFRADGPWEPASGQRFNPDKLLLDPVAREVRGSVAWQSPVYDYSVDGEGNWSRDSTNFVVELITLRKQCLPFLNPVRDDAEGQPQLAVQWYGHNGNRLSAEMLPAESGHAFQICYSHSENTEQWLRVLINNEPRPVSFSFAEQGPQALWWRILSTAESDPFYREVLLYKGWYPVPARGVVVIREHATR